MILFHDITSSHNKYVENMIGNIKENSKPFWKYISLKRKDTQTIPPLDILLIDCVIHCSDLFPLHIFDGACFSTAGCKKVFIIFQLSVIVLVFCCPLNIKENSKPFWKYISLKRKDTQTIPPLDTKQ
jgi:hypothetical protein